MYLNDVPNGGVTRFEYLDLDVQPKKGKCLVFFPASVAAMPDPRTLHTATEAENGCGNDISVMGESLTPPASAGISDNSASAGTTDTRKTQRRPDRKRNKAARRRNKQENFCTYQLLYSILFLFL